MPRDRCVAGRAGGAPRLAPCELRAGAWFIWEGFRVVEAVVGWSWGNRLLVLYDVDRDRQLLYHVVSIGLLQPQAKNALIAESCLAAEHRQTSQVWFGKSTFYAPVSRPFRES